MIRRPPPLALAALLAAGLALELAQPAVPAVPPAAPPPAAAAPAAASPDEDALDALVQTILARPVLHPSRRPPDAAEDGPSTPVDDALPRLTGVLVSPEGRRAIFAPGPGRAILLGEGDSLGGYTITSIAPHEVTLAGSQGERVLRPSLIKAPPAGPVPRNGAHP
jgi:hypothetical protein